MEGALFCHKCGRPLFEPVREETPESDAVVEVPVGPPLQRMEVPAKQQEISFQNSVAVRVGFLVAGLGVFASNLMGLLGSPPLQLIGFILLFMGSGALAVWLYKRRTGQLLSVQSGARLGWITGVLSFTILIVLMTLTLAMVGFEKVAELFRDPAVSGVSQAEIERLLESPAQVATVFAFVLAIFFGAFTVAASVGGAMGAKLLHKDGDSI